VVGAVGEVGPPEPEAGLVAGMLLHEAHRGAEVPAVADDLDPVGRGAVVGSDAPLDDAVEASCGTRVAVLADGVAEVGRDRDEGVHPHGVADRPRSEHGDDECGRHRRMNEAASPPEPADSETDPEGDQEEERERPDRAGRTEGEPEGDEAPPTHGPRLRHGDGERDEDEAVEEGLQLRDRRVVDEVRPQRDEGGGDESDSAVEQAAPDEVGREHRDRPGDDVEHPHRPPEVVREGRVPHEPEDAGQRGRVPDRVERGRRVRHEADVAVPAGDLLPVVRVGDGVTGLRRPRRGSAPAEGARCRGTSTSVAFLRPQRPESYDSAGRKVGISSRGCGRRERRR
jgi:hypothetical protein